MSITIREELAEIMKNKTTNFALVLEISILLALPTGLYHVMRGKRSHVDDVASELLYGRESNEENS